MQIFSYLPFESLLICGLVNRRWRALGNDQSLWKVLCRARGWAWRHASQTVLDFDLPERDAECYESNDEGMGDSDGQEDTDNGHVVKNAFTKMDSTSNSDPLLPQRSRSVSGKRQFGLTGPKDSHRPSARHSSFFMNKSFQQSSYPMVPNYKLLYQTHIKLRNRFLGSSYRLSVLQTRGAPGNGHTNTIYCLQLYTYPESGLQVLFTGSRDRTVREWNLRTGKVEHVISDVHSSSVLSICAHRGYLASAGSDGRVGLWHLEDNRIVKIIRDHEDSVLCVRFDDTRLVSCSKGMSPAFYYVSNSKAPIYW